VGSPSKFHDEPGNLQADSEQEKAVEDDNSADCKLLDADHDHLGPHDDHANNHAHDTEPSSLNDRRISA